jgi:hypothetical protein
MRVIKFVFFVVVGMMVHTVFTWNAGESVPVEKPSQYHSSMVI